MTLIIILIIIAAVVFQLCHVSIPSGKVGLKTQFGKFIKQLEPGLNFKIPFIQQITLVSMQLQPINVDRQDLITKDNVSVSASEKLKYVVTDAQKFAFGNADSVASMIQDAQSSLRSIIGAMTIDEVLQGQEIINERLSEDLDKTTSAYGLRVDSVAISEINVDKDIQDAMNQERTAELTKRAVIKQSEGDKEAKINQATADAETKRIEAQARAQAQTIEAQTQANIVRIKADADAYQTLKTAIANNKSIQANLDAYAQKGFSITDLLNLRQIEALNAIASGENNTVLTTPDMIKDIQETTGKVKSLNIDSNLIDNLTKQLEKPSQNLESIEQ